MPMIARRLPALARRAAHQRRHFNTNPRLEEWNGIREDVQKTWKVEREDTFAFLGWVFLFPIGTYSLIKAELVRRRRADRGNVAVWLLTPRLHRRAALAAGQGRRQGHQGGVPVALASQSRGGQLRWCARHKMLS